MAPMVLLLQQIAHLGTEISGGIPTLLNVAQLSASDPLGLCLTRLEECILPAMLLVKERCGYSARFEGRRSHYGKGSHS
jgi:hypothetical protein